jgi:dTDP-4-dehydrorhamnose 3,5-epimerase
MNIVKHNSLLEGVFIIEPKVFSDERGFFFESYNKNSFAEQGIHIEFVQDNHSRSQHGVLRGLHYQDMAAPLIKLVRCTYGEILDVVVDLRAGSPTLGKHIAIELSMSNKRQVLVPVGFGHGFVTLSEFAEVQYKCDNFYAPKSEGVILWSDSDLGIDWRLKDPIISKRDASGMSFKDYLRDPKFFR